MIRGVDVARFQRVDWDAVPMEREFALIGMLDWREQQIDNQAELNVREGSRTGRLLGGYLRANPPRWSPATEARRFVGLLAHLGLSSPGRLWPAIDIEPTGDRAADARVDWPTWTREFLAAYRDLCGLPLLVYSSGSYFGGLLGGTTSWPEWVRCWVGHSERYARPAGTPAEEWAGRTWYEPERVVLHQYSTTGQVPGVTSPAGGPQATDLDCLMPGRALADITLRGGS